MTRVLLDTAVRKYLLSNGYLLVPSVLYLRTVNAEWLPNDSGFSLSRKNRDTPPLSDYLGGTYEEPGTTATS